jgi:hypothetical protein
VDKTTGQKSEVQQFETDRLQGNFSVKIPRPHNSSPSSEIKNYSLNKIWWIKQPNNLRFHRVPGSVDSSRDIWYLNTTVSAVKGKDMGIAEGKVRVAKKWV